jgi:CDP-diacylglycerol--glycerol-3-phosphate 3-phosphatidyltransferase
MLLHGSAPLIAAVVVFIIAALTDYYDGYYARKLGADSTFGQFFDPLADKFLTTAAFIAFVLLDIVPLWMVIIVILRDFGTTFLRVYFDKNNLSFKTSFAAKAKTMIQMIFISYVLLLLMFIKVNFGDFLTNLGDYLLYSRSTWWVMLAITGFSVWTLFDYLIPLFKRKA